MKNNWLEMYKMYNTTVVQEIKFLEDSKFNEKDNNQNSISIEMSFDKWDFNSSAKKSFDSNLDLNC